MGGTDREILTPEQAKALLRKGLGGVHTFMNPGPALLVGADWSRAHTLEMIDTADVLEVGGEACVRMGHGLVLQKDGRTYFVESNAGK